MGDIAEVTQYLDGLYNSQRAAQQGIQQSMYNTQLATQQSQMSAYMLRMGSVNSSVTPLAYLTSQKKAPPCAPSNLDWLNAEIDRVRLPLT